MNQNPYRAPDTLPLVGGSAPSPRARFWIACLCSFFAAPLLSGVAAIDRHLHLFFWAFLGLLLAWIGAIIWVWSAHLQLPGAYSGPLRSLIVAAGLTIAMAISFFLGIAAMSLIFAPFR